MSPAEIAAAETLIALAIAEDLGEVGDLTATATIPADAQGAARVVAREPGVVAGLAVVQVLAETIGLGDGWKAVVADGTRVDKGSVVAEVAGSMRVVLAFERTALNILQHLSGIDRKSVV